MIFNHMLLNNIYTFTDIIIVTLSILLVVGSIVCFFNILLWGLLLIISWWNKDKVSNSYRMITYSVIGLICMVMSIYLFPEFFRLLWLPNPPITPKQILDKSITIIKGIGLW